MNKSRLALAALFATLFLTQSGAALANTIETDVTEAAGITLPDALDLNTVTAEELTALPGIGLSKAEAIIAYRNEKGYFHEVDQLTEVRGIGEKLLAKVRDRVKVVQH
ncbi:ComEA family DNA-binding protein [Alteromonas sp. 1_MG-2023]|uniref:ComEA family DNA-binding protein n=1 Tax=unclassified Alteromonas TaxID=2614992 RepID=UPI0026E1A5EF|nr:ComEA family DNA-binding protein [Alteromonas sp. 1_MG-2023]MDO6476570.1 ComEA family DNA-binding protein [Alteromonas sp. 1_MG-2023]